MKNGGISPLFQRGPRVGKEGRLCGGPKGYWWRACK